MRVVLQSKVDASFLGKKIIAICECFHSKITSKWRHFVLSSRIPQVGLAAMLAWFLLSKGKKKKRREKCYLDS